MSASQEKIAGGSGENTSWLKIVEEHVQSLRYGVVEIVVHDSQVTQIQKTERVRLEPRRSQRA